MREIDRSQQEKPKPKPRQLKSLAEISREVDMIIKGYEMKRRKSDLIESLRTQGFQGSAEEILQIYRWLTACSGAKEEKKELTVEEELALDLADDTGLSSSDGDIDVKGW